MFSNFQLWRFSTTKNNIFSPGYIQAAYVLMSFSCRLRGSFFAGLWATFWCKTQSKTLNRVGRSVGSTFETPPPHIWLGFSFVLEGTESQFLLWWSPRISCRCSSSQLCILFVACPSLSFHCHRTSSLWECVGKAMRLASENTATGHQVGPELQGDKAGTIGCTVWFCLFVFLLSGVETHEMSGSSDRKVCVSSYYRVHFQYLELHKMEIISNNIVLRLS